MLVLKSGNPLKRKCDLLVIPVFGKKEIFADKKLNEFLAGALKVNEFKGKASEELLLYDLPGVASKRLFFAGLGSVREVNDENLRDFAGRLVKKAIDMKLKTISFVMPDSRLFKRDYRNSVKAVFEGASLGNYIFDQYLSEKKKKRLESIEIFTSPQMKNRLCDLPGEILKTCEGTLLARTWVSDPSNEKTPDKFVQRMEDIFKGTNIRFSYFKKKKLEALGFGALLAVAQGSQNSPCLAFAEYKPEKYSKTIVIVGKGVTFDSGGLDVKTAAGMIDMKSDMAGAATVGAAIHSIALLMPDVRVVGVMPLVENMPSGSAYRPGDILKTYSGKTVEVGNTDAEGRLILADALSYAEDTYKPDMIIDIATLTGACVIALGEKIAGVFSFSTKLAKMITGSGERTGERCWMMPMPKDYKKLLKSEFADMSNMSSSRYGGAITAALFLSEFVNTKNWVHIDIAGPSYLMKPSDYSLAGGTGFGVRLICDFISNL